MSSQEYAQLTESAASEPWSQLFRRNALDIIASVACLALTLLLEATVEPYHQFLQLTQLYDIAYPLKKNTVPAWSVIPIALLVPGAAFALLAQWQALAGSPGENRRTAAKLFVGLFCAFSATFLATSVIKLSIGRYRPDFMARCWGTTNLTAVLLLPGGAGLGENCVSNCGYPVCTNTDKAVVKEGHKAMPSGHVSLTGAGLWFLSLYLLRLSRTTRVLGGRAPFATLIAALLPLLLLIEISITRMTDYWHRSADVGVAAALSGSIAFFTLHRVLPATAPAAGEAEAEPHAALPADAEEV